MTDMKTKMKRAVKEYVKKNERIQNLWKKRITENSTLSAACAEWMANRISALLDHMQYGYALIAYRKQNGDFQLGRATLIYYEHRFNKKYNPEEIKSHVVYWDADQQGWRTFLLENFLEWRPIVN